MKFRFVLNLLLILLFLYFIFLIREDIIRLAEVKDRSKQINKLLQNEKERTIYLDGQIQKLKDSSFVEYLARYKLGLVKKGEILFKPVGKAPQN